MSDVFDVIVIGGGSAGVGTARDCAKRGLKTVLVERNDIASGAVATCAGMISAGPKYFMEPPMVKLCVAESAIIAKIARNVIFSTPILLVGLDKSEVNQGKLFTAAYDGYSELRKGDPIITLTTDEALRLEPKLSPNIMSAIYIREYFIDPFRLTLMNALDAKQHGAQILTYTEVVDILRERNTITGVRVKDRFSGEVREIKGKIVVNASGPWGSKVAKMAGLEHPLRLNKGSHVIFDRRISDIGIYAKCIDGRRAYLFPHENTTILGTTAVDIFCDPDEVETTYDDVEYLMMGMEKAIPSIRKARIIRTMTGVRPMINQYGIPEDKVTRNFEIIDFESKAGVSGFLSFGGGKLVLYRIMAEKMTDLICKKLDRSTECRTQADPLIGAEQEVNVERLAGAFGIYPHMAAKLAYLYGTKASDVLMLTQENPQYKMEVCNCESIPEAAIRYSIRNEWAKTLNDVRRRTRIAMGPCQGCTCIPKVAAIAADELKQSPEVLMNEMKDLLQERWKGKRPLLLGRQLVQEEVLQSSYSHLGEAWNRRNQKGSDSGEKETKCED
ncbi:MAG: FAD-dependent oxidoreductase [Candidatus Atabeyarchaeum deiterrae]